MSITMSRPTLPSISQSVPQLPRLSTSSSTTPSNIRSLPPLSALLNGPIEETSKQQQITKQESSPTMSHSAPVSPKRHGSTDLYSHKIGQPSSALVTTPVRLPSFDSIKFDQSSSNQPSLHHSKSFNVLQSTSIPTPTSQPLQPLLQATTNTTQALNVPQQQATQSNLVSPLVEKRAYAFISHSPSTFPSHEPSIDNAQLARRKRRRTSPLELSILQQEFEKGQTPNRTRRLEIAKRVNMTEKAIQIWFQNRRQTLRRQSNAEKEIHHIEPIYHQPQVPPTVQTTSTPIKPQNMIYSTPSILNHPHHQPQPPKLPFYQGSSSSPVKIDASIVSGPPSSSSQASSPHSSPIHQQSQSQFPIPQQIPQQPSSQQQQPNFLVTPARTPKTNTTNTKSPIGGSTLTFRLNSKPKQSIKINDKSNTMTPISSITRTRQKPVMKVNPTPSKSSPVHHKENISPRSSPSKNQNISPVRGGERIVLGELSYNSKNKPKVEDQCVENLLSLRNWK